MTPVKEMLLRQMNDALQRAHEEASENARRKGKPIPPAPVMLTPEQVEFPRWLHKDWKPTGKAHGHYEPGKSKLAKSAEEVKALIAKGWTEEAPKAGKEVVAED